MRVGWFIALLWIIVATPALAQEEYRLGPEDVIRITITGYEQLSTAQATVSALGTISLPVLGSIQVQGHTPDEVGTLVSQMLIRYVKGAPTVQVSIIEINSRKIRVLGAVKIPGEQKLPPGATLVDVLAMAGDVAEDADTNKVQIISADGSRQQVNLNKYFQTGDASLLPLLKADDMIRVPRRRTLNNSNGATPLPNGDTTETVINVWGNVANPGQFMFYSVPTLLEVLTRVGGVQDELALKRIQVIRGDPRTGGQISVDMRQFLETGAYDLLPALQSGDTIYVPEVRQMDRLKQQEVVVMGEVNSPGSYPIDGEVPLADVLALAGGFTREADPGKVRISREQSGILRHRDIDMRSLLSGHSPEMTLTTLPTVHPGDMVVVSNKKSGLLSAANVSRGLIAFFVDMVALYGLYQALTK